MGEIRSLDGFVQESRGIFGRCEGWLWDLGILGLPQHLQMVVMMLPYSYWVPYREDRAATALAEISCWEYRDGGKMSQRKQKPVGYSFFLGATKLLPVSQWMQDRGGSSLEQ